MGLGPGSGFAGFFPGVNQGLKDVQDYDERQLQNKQRAEYLQAQQRENQAANIAYTNQLQRGGYSAQTPQVQTGDPVLTKLAGKFKGLFQKNQAPNQSTAGQSTPPAAQATTPPGSNAAASAPGPSSSSPSAGGVPGATGAQTLDSETQPVTQAGLSPRQGNMANGGAIPGRTGLRLRKAKPGNIAKPTKAAAGAMHPSLEKAPVDAATMGAEGGPSGNTDAEPGSQDPMLANGGNIQSPMTGGMSQGEYNAVQKDADGNFIQKAIKKPGQLHKDLGVPQGQKIPKDKLDAAAKSGGKVGQRARFAETLNKFSNGGKVAPVQTMEPKPQPNALEKDVSNDGQRNRLGRTLKRFADGDQVTKPDDSKPAVGLEPAQPLPESTLQHLAKQGMNMAGGAMRAIASPGGIPGYLGLSAGEEAGRNAGAQLASPWDPPKQTPAAPSGPPQTTQSAAAEGPPDDSMDGRDRRHATPIDVISPAEAKRRQAAGESGAFMVDENGEPAPASPVPSRGTAAPPTGQDMGAGPPKPAIDFSNVDLDHTQIPNTTAEDWDQVKKDSVLQLVAKGVPASQAQITVNDQISDYQHRQFLEMMQQGIALDRAGNKNGAMAALKTAYQYMPTGHDVHFGIDKTTGNIVGYGVDEKTGKPVGAPVLLDQKNLNGLLSTFSDPKAFVNESLAMRSQALHEKEVTQGQIPLQRAQAQDQLATANYKQGINDTRLETAMIRGQGHGLAPQSQKFYAQQLNGAILDPRDQGEALGVAEVLESKYGNSAQAQGKIAGIVKQLYSMPPDQRAQFAAQNGIPMPGTQQAPTDPSTNYLMGVGGYGSNSGGYGVPPR